MPETISKVLVVEDESIFRSLICDHLQNEFKNLVVIEANDGEEGWAKFRLHEPEFCIIDLRLPKLRGEVLIDLMQRHHKPARILVLTGQATGDLVESIRNPQRLFFVDKMAPLERLNDALMLFLDSQDTDPGPFGLEDNAADEEGPLARLTSRERTILGLIGEGKKSQAISEMLDISIHTVRVHRRNLMQKLNINSAAMLVRFALDHGLAGGKSID
jgi:two-component system response regulator NreC